MGAWSDDVMAVAMAMAVAMVMLKIVPNIA